MNPLYTIEQLPTTSAAALREFDDRYIAAMAAAQPTGWADKFGALVPTNAPMVTFPVSQLRSKFTRTQGEGRAKTFLERSFDVKAEEFDDGYEAKYYDLTKQAFAYRRWKDAAPALVVAEARFRMQQVAALLAAGTTTACVDGKNFFATDHPANLFDDDAGTYSNYQSAATDVVSIANLEQEVAAMQQVKDENGDFMGVAPDTILCGVRKAEPLKNLLKQSMIANAAGDVSVTNPYMNGFNIEVVPDFGTSLNWYLVDSKLVGELSPWIMLRENVAPALQTRIWDESSDYFKKLGKLRYEKHIWYGFGVGLPHAIRKIVGA